MAERHQRAIEYLRRQGIVVSRLDDLRATGPLDAKTVVAILDLLAESRAEGATSVANRGFQELLVRTLTVAEKAFPGDELIRIFEDTQDDALRWAIANTLATGKAIAPHGWLIDRALDITLRSAREMLVLALASQVPAARAVPVLRSLFEALPGHVAIALGSIGGPREREFLISHRSDAHRVWVRREIEKAIKRIERRRKMATGVSKPSRI
jgi:hypothetical protein